MSEVNSKKNTLDILESFASFKQNCGIIVATSFSMIIFLLSLIKQRTIFLEIGILFLLVSTLSLFELIRYLTGFTKRFPDGVDSKEEISVDCILNFLNDLGVFFFFLGLLFFIYHFNLNLIGFLLNGYLIYRGARFIDWRLTFLKRDKDLLTEEEIKKYKLKLDKWYLGFSFVPFFINVTIFSFIFITDLLKV